MLKYIGNSNITSINYQGGELKKLYLGNNLTYWNIETKSSDGWEEINQVINYNEGL